LILKNFGVHGVHFWESRKYLDKRGHFTKILPVEVLDLIQPFTLNDAFVSTSAEGVVRGMHLQVGNYAGGRIIHVLRGKIEDVIVDLRPDSITKGKVFSQTLVESELDTVYIPGNIAHGFESILESQLIYFADKPHEPTQDKGINPLTLPYKWKSESPIISDRDLSLPEFKHLIP
jgi:dTDP-4-dehydrorhamnose 3,5-epimerase